MGRRRETWVFLSLLMGVRLRLGDRAQGEGTREVSTFGSKVGKMSSESSMYREWGGEVFFFCFFFVVVVYRMAR